MRYCLVYAHIQAYNSCRRASSEEELTDPSLSIVQVQPSERIPDNASAGYTREDDNIDIDTSETLSFIFNTQER